MLTNIIVVDNETVYAMPCIIVNAIYDRALVQIKYVCIWYYSSVHVHLTKWNIHIVLTHQYNIYFFCILHLFNFYCHLIFNAL